MKAPQSRSLWTCGSAAMCNWESKLLCRQLLKASSWEKNACTHIIDVARCARQEEELIELLMLLRLHIVR